MLKDLNVKETMSISGGTTDPGAGCGSNIPDRKPNVSSIATENMVSPHGGSITGHLFDAVR